jgi:hypothetical protein
VLRHMILDKYYEVSVFGSNEAAETEPFLGTCFLETHLWIATTGNKLRF